MARSLTTNSWQRNLRTVLAQQDWALLVLIIACSACVAVMEFMEPVQRPVFIYDATIAYENKPNTVESVLAPLIPAIVFVISLVLIECYLFRKDRVATGAAVMRFFMACWAALTVVGFFTELFKLICGRLRPDFLDRCKPLIQPGDVMKNFDLMAQNREWGQSKGIICTNTDARFIRDGRVSFPSGHSSTALVVGWFGAFYLIWGTNVRSDQQMQKRLYRPDDSVLRRVGKELISCWLLGLTMFQLGYPWGVGVSRFRDNRHNASDIIAGFVLSLTFAPAFLVRAIGQHDYWLNFYGIADDDGGASQVAPVSNGADPKNGAAPAVAIA